MYIKIYDKELETIKRLLTAEEHRMQEVIANYEKLTKGDRINYPQAYYYYKNDIIELSHKISSILENKKTSYTIGG